MKKTLIALLVFIFFQGCSEVGVVREKVCENKNNIKLALDILCTTTSPAEAKALEDSLNIWLGLK